MTPGVPANLPKRNHKVAGSIISAVTLSAAQLPDANWRQRDICTARKPKQQRIEYKDRHLSSCRQPQRYRSKQAQRYCHDHRIEPSKAVSKDARQPAAEE